MKPFVERMVAERKELGERHDKLESYLTSAGFEALSHQEQDWLTKQFDAMSTYWEVLNQRITFYEGS